MPPTMKLGCGFGRQAVVRVAVITVGKNTQLAGFNEVLELRLGIGEIARAGLGIARNRLRQLGSRLGVRRQRGNHVHPVERVQVIEVHHVVVHVLGADHQVADQLRVGGDIDSQRVFYRTYRGDPVHQRADAADALGKGPGVARVAALQDQFDAAHHGAGTPGAGDLPVIGSFRLDAQVPFDAGDRIHHYSCHDLFSMFALGVSQKQTPFRC
jgi:hypothetical protein